MLDKSALMEMMRRMLRIRHFEEAVISLVERGEIVGAAHSYIGEEAVAVGACMALRDDDWMTGNHRSHGHPIAKGGNVKTAMAELLGKKTGICKGKGGSMHLADFSIGILGESGILGSSIPVAVGAALGSRLQNNDRVAVCFFGDGASNEGAFHESINLAGRVEAAGDLPLREQPVRRHQQLQGNGGGGKHLRPRRRLRHPRRAGGRAGRAGDARGGDCGGGEGSFRAGADAGRGPHLPLLRPLPGPGTHRPQLLPR